MQIESIILTGFRGVKEKLTLNLSSKSFLIYGENGAGKSSITDAIEWFYRDSVSHLSCEEIDKKGLSALPNTSKADMEQCAVEFNFSKNNFNSQKSIIIKKLNLEVKDSNTSDLFRKYIEKSSGENLILRYEDLTEFVLSTKKQKLDSLSKVIGFTEVSYMRSVLKKAVNEIKNEFKTRNFDNEISRREAEILEQMNENIVSDKQYFKKVNEIILPVGLDIEVKNFKDLSKVLSLLKKTDDSVIIEQRAFYGDVLSKIKDLQDRIDKLPDLYNEFFQSFKKIVGDVETLKKISLSNLWAEGLRVLKSSIVEKDECPLCFRGKNRQELIKEIELRIKTLDSIKKQKSQIEDAKRSVQNALNGIKDVVTGIQSSKYFSIKENQILKDFVEYSTEYIAQINQELGADVLKEQMIKTKDELIFDGIKISKALDFCKKGSESLDGQIKGNKILEIREKLLLSERIYNEIKKLKKEKEVLEKQKNTLDIIYNAFIKKQKEELESFISAFSKEINDYYQYMHPGEKVENIEIKLTEKDDELTGITIEFKFFNTVASPPQKYLSESHLNSLGIAFFLASVKAFNRENQFFILDDIISSFDSNHRKRLGDLLLDKFLDYQIIILTHERNWFDYMKNLVKGKTNWMINVLKWNESRGTYLNETLVDLKTIIEGKLVDNDKIGLGNLMRRYLEGVLKEICEELAVKVEYRSNEVNEDRMSNELLSELKSKINKQPCKKDFENIINQISSSIFLGNKDSHDSNFEPSIGECRAFWQDVEFLERLFRCSVDECKKLISKKYYDSVEKKIRCKCGQLKYDWLA